MSIPRTEYPRPTLRRGEDSWLCLNGTWEFAFDFGNSGRERKMWEAPKYEREITVPFVPESKLSGIEYVDFIPAVWYRRAVTLPEGWCPKCGRINYPRLNPAVIVAVLHEDKILVTTYSDRPSLGMACIAGFAEIGETIEECVHREVFEETGLKVKNLRFYKSQPWSFTDTLLFGFYCDLDGDDETVHVDPNELKEGHWIKREDMPDRSGQVSLTAEMQETFRLGREPR